MKRTISILSVLAFVLAFSGSVFAQTDITATAEVLQEISYGINGTQISFGNLETSFTSATVAPSGTGSDSGVSNATAARITVNGANSETVLVTDPGTLTLTGPNSDALDLATSVTGATGDVTTARGGTSLTNGNELSLNGSGIGTLWIGGDLSVNTDNGDGLDAGTYSTTFTLTLNYL